MTTDPQTLAKKLRYTIEGAFRAYFQPEVAEQIEKQLHGLVKGCEKHGSVLCHAGMEKQVRDQGWDKKKAEQKGGEKLCSK